MEFQDLFQLTTVRLNCGWSCRHNYGCLGITIKLVALHRLKKIAQEATLAAGGAVTVEGIRQIGPALLSQLTDSLQYTTGLGIGMADLPFEAIEWYDVLIVAGKL